MLRNVTFSLIAAVLSLSSRAQTAADTTRAAAPAPPALSITGSADIYYRYDFHRPTGAPYNAYTSFTQTHDQVQLGMATLKLEHKTSKLDMVADLGFGQRAKDFDYADDTKNGGSGGVLQAIKQLYISYSPTAWIKFTGGTWATHVGYEVMDAYANRNYSMSYMFTNGPFSHTGLRADLSFGKSGVMIGVSNPTDYRVIPQGLQNNKNLIAQYSYAASDNFKLFLNYVGGRDVQDNKVHQYDLVINSKLSGIFGIGVNGTFNRTSIKADPADDVYDGHNWYGGAVYLILDPKPWFGLTLREEYFNDKDGLKLPSPGGNVFASTLTASFKVDGFTFMPELRLDNGSKEFFSKHDGTTSKTDGSFLIAAVYSF
ncbi:MAG TPA: outer membrane beta-barrel protein [Puia sp.]